MRHPHLFAGILLAMITSACGEAEDTNNAPAPEPDMVVEVDMTPDVAPDLPPACPVEGESLCSGQCVDTQTNPEHCGECGERCGRGAGCKMGACFCLTGGTWCGPGECLATLNDANNCGECGKSCGDGEYCVNGGCVADQELAEVVRLTNEARKLSRMCGTTSHSPVGQLTVNMLLNTAAQGHAEDMAKRNYFEHDTPDGVTPTQRMRAAGYTGGTTGENIAYGQRDAADVVQAWIDSPGHCRNIMSGGYSEIGIGVYRDPASGRIYWVQNFGAP
jgi:uncharacterized protein YkwD